MGWAHCGEDSTGREIGYAIEATCDHEGCTKKIDRGLSYACGGMHGDPDGSCEGYFCAEHRVYSEHAAGGDGAEVCLACAKAFDEEKRCTCDDHCDDPCTKHVCMDCGAAEISSCRCGALGG